MSSSYTRNTELRNVHSKDLYNLAVILDDDNYWQTLMEIIPKDINNQTFGTAENLEKISSGAAYERKYNNDHIRLIENAIKRPGESRLYSQILFDEWSSSGQKHERPTLGVLLHLLVLSKLFRAADFVAELLNEPKPSRPRNGPAAEFEYKIDVFKDIEETMNDTRFYPNTEDLIQNTNIDINKDYYEKYNNIDNKLRLLNDNSEETMMTAPTPPPRLLKSERLKQQQEHLNLSRQETANKTNIENTNSGSENNQSNHQTNTQTYTENVLKSSSVTRNNIPNLPLLMRTTNSEIRTTNNLAASENVLPNLSILINSPKIVSQSHESYVDSSLNSTPSLIYSKPNIIEDQKHSDLDSIPVVVLSKPLNSEPKLDNNDELHYDLPAISALNLNVARDKAVSQQQSNNLESVPSVASNIFAEESANSSNDFIIPCTVENINYNENLTRHQLEAIEEDYNGVEHYHAHDEVELEDDEDSIPNLSFLENRSSNNESSLTSVTNTSGDNSFEQSVNDCSSTSTDNVPFLSVLNQ